MAGYKATGKCLCGGIQFEYSTRLTKVHNCHCSMCRKSIGAPYATFGLVPAANFKLTKQDKLCSYRSSGIGSREFCGTCGSSLFYKADKMADQVFVSLPTVDAGHGTKADFHIFVSSKADWVEINDALSKHDGYGPLGDDLKL